MYGRMSVCWCVRVYGRVLVQEKAKAKQAQMDGCGRGCGPRRVVRSRARGRVVSERECNMLCYGVLWHE